jgi:hypothetical protein
MAATYVTMQELRNNLGIGTLYLDATVEEVCQSAQDIIDAYLWYNSALVYSTALTSNVATITTTQPHGFVTGQSVTITKSDTATFNGTYTITGYTTFTFTYSRTASDQTTHLVVPFGLVRGPNHSTAYASVAAIREASMMIAVDIWQARQAPSGQGASIDNFVPSPFKMSNTLIARVRGLLAPYMAPTAMVG